MEYTEIVARLSEAGHFSTLEIMRVAVEEEANNLFIHLDGYTKATALEAARRFYAEDITSWVEHPDNNLDPEVLLGARERYAKSWAFAQLINRIPTETT